MPDEILVRKFLSNAELWAEQREEMVARGYNAIAEEQKVNIELDMWGVNLATGADGTKTTHGLAKLIWTLLQ